MKITELKPLENNPFKGKGDKQIEAIGKSIESFKKMMEIEPLYCQVIINRMRRLNPEIEIKCLNREFNL